MLVVLSPAKAMATVAKSSKLNSVSAPPLVGESDAVLSVMKSKSKTEIKSMMSLSDAIAQLNFDRYRDFHDSTIIRKFTDGKLSSIAVKGLKCAALVFDGPAYRGLRAETFSVDEADRAQQSIEFCRVSTE